MNGAIATADTCPLWMRVVFGRHPRRTLIRLTVLVVASFIIFRFIFIPIRVSGLSMLPTFKEGKITLVNHLAYRWNKPRRGDVVAIRVPAENNVVLLKRIVGLPGETVRISKGKVMIDGVFLDEPYAKTKDGRSEREVRLQESFYFVVGDNRRITVLGAVHESEILGKVLF